ncbi:MAG: hypothetical protein IPL49_01030 [Saprospirales bacterium]|nr:hypothetical protein [Saprospirales bacterium]
MVVEGKDALHESFKQFYSNANPEDEMTLNKSTVRFIDSNHALFVYDAQGSSVMDGQKFEWKSVGAVLLVRTRDGWKIELETGTPVMEMPGQ